MRAQARTQAAAQAVLERLSPRETEVARLVALGMPNKQIARELGISEKTVHIHRQHAMDKTGASNAPGLTRLILRADPDTLDGRSEEHTSELQSLMRISYAVFCLKKK